MPRMCEAAEEQCGKGDAEACRTACEDCGIKEVCTPAETKVVKEAPKKAGIEAEVKHGRGWLMVFLLLR